MSELLGSRYEVKWRETQAAWIALCKTKGKAAAELAEIKGSIKNAESARDLLLREDTPADPIRQFGQAHRLHMKIEKLEKAHKNTKQRWDGVIASIESAFHNLITTDQLPLLLPDMTVTTVALLDGAPVIAGERIVHKETGAEHEIVGFRTVDGEERIVCMLEGGNEALFSFGEVERVAVDDVDHAPQDKPGAPASLGGLRLGDLVRDPTTGRLGSVVQVLAGVAKIGILWEHGSEPTTHAPANVERVNVCDADGKEIRPGDVMEAVAEFTVLEGGKAREFAKGERFTVNHPVSMLEFVPSDPTLPRIPTEAVRKVTRGRKKAPKKAAKRKTTKRGSAKRKK